MTAQGSRVRIQPFRLQDGAGVVQSLRVGGLVLGEVVLVHQEAYSGTAEHNPVDGLLPVQESQRALLVQAGSTVKSGVRAHAFIRGGGQVVDHSVRHDGAQAERGHGIGHGSQPVDGGVHVHILPALGLGGEPRGLKRHGHGYVRVLHSHQVLACHQGGQVFLYQGIREGHSGGHHRVPDLSRVLQRHQAVLVQNRPVIGGVMEDQEAGPGGQAAYSLRMVRAAGIQNGGVRPVRCVPGGRDTPEVKGLSPQTSSLNIQGHRPGRLGNDIGHSGHSMGAVVEFRGQRGVPGAKVRDLRSAAQGGGI